MNCWKCNGLVEEQDKFCRHCGAGLGGNMPWYYHWWGILVIMVCIGPLALPYVYKSPLLSKAAKSFWTAVICAFTVAVVWLIYYGISKMFAALNAAMTGNFDGFGY